MAATKTTATRDLASELVFLTRALKAPTLRDAATRLAERVHTEAWSHEEFLIACLQREVAAREAHGGEGPVPRPQKPRGVRLRPRRGLKRETIAHLGTLDFITAKDNVVFLGPTRHRQDPPVHRNRDPRLPSRPPRAVRHRRAMGRRPADAHTAGRLQDELIRLGRYPLLVIDEVGYIPFKVEAANLFSSSSCPPATNARR